MSTHQSGLSFSQRHQVHLQGRGEGQCSLRACQEPADVYLFSVSCEGVSLKQTVKSIAVIAAAEPGMGKLFSYLYGIMLVRESIPKVAVNARLKEVRIPFALFPEFVSSQ